MARVFLKRGIKLDKSISLTPEWQILLLNTQMEKEHWGYLAESETAFLANNLKALQQKNILIFMHHHPISIASPWMDNYQLRNSDTFLATIRPYHNIQAVAFGHVHQVFDKVIAEKRYLSAPSTHIQFHPGAKKRQFDSLAPGYRWFKIHPNFYESGINRLNFF
jgi:Icc protein